MFLSCGTACPQLSQNVAPCGSLAPQLSQKTSVSGGCTVPTAPKDPIKPGEKGVIKVQYNGKGKFPGAFKKPITVRSNASNAIVRLYIQGTMVVEEEK